MADINVVTNVLILMVLLCSIPIMGGILYMLWKLLGAFRWMEMCESNRQYNVYSQVPGVSLAGLNRNNIPVTKEQEAGAFVPRNDFDSYVQEEASNLSRSTGISDTEAIDILLTKIREQNANKVAGNIANV
jgi:hypothetical protein